MTAGTDWVQIATTLIGILGTIVPAVWMLSSKIQGLSGDLRANAARVEEKINSLERVMAMDRELLKEAMAQQDDLRERLAVTEVHVHDLRKKAN